MQGKAPTILEVCGLRVERGGTIILDGVNWRVERGQHWVILGANGSGKTSLLSALTGYLTPTAGEISLLGKTYGDSDWRELRKQIGIVSSAVRQMMADDEPALETVASGKYAMIDFWGRLPRADKNRARKILRQIDMRPSGGTSVARALAGRTPAGIDWPGADGQAAGADSRRTVRRARSRPRANISCNFSSGSAGNEMRRRWCW